MFSLFNAYLEEKNTYGFNHTWTVNAEPDKVWHALAKFRDWPAWWEGLETIQCMASPPVIARGTRIRSTWKGSLPYRLTFDAQIRSFVLGESLCFGVDGDLEGHGRCIFKNAAGRTQIQFSWQVAPTKLWFKMSAPFARSLFEENHDLIMAQAQKGLSRIFP